MKLTKATVERLELAPGKSEAIFFDEALSGFGLRIRAGGKRTWIVQYRLGSKQRRVTLGPLGALDADEARKRAKEALAKVHLGGDPQLEKAEGKAQAAVTFASVVEQYLSRHASKKLKPRTLEGVTRYLRRHWGVLAKVPVAKVTRAAVSARLGEIIDESGEYAANRARAAISRLYTWAIEEGLVDANPVVGTRKPSREVSRDRVLTEDELAGVWRHAGAGDHGAILRLLILTGQRREEVGAMRWSEIDLEGAVWRIGAERTKNGRAHEVPLSAETVGVLRGVTRREGRELVFGSRAGGFSGWSKAKAALDVRIAGELGQFLEPWRLHDVRRTMATEMASLGVLPHVVEAVLNHISGHKAGVAGVYNRSTYAAETRDALDRWGAHVAGVIKYRQSFLDASERAELLDRHESVDDPSEHKEIARRVRSLDNQLSPAPKKAAVERNRPIEDAARQLIAQSDHPPSNAILLDQLREQGFAIAREHESRGANAMTARTARKRIDRARGRG